MQQVFEFPVPTMILVKIFYSVTGTLYLSKAKNTIYEIPNISTLLIDIIQLYE